MTTLIESSQVPPPPGVVAELSLPLTFIDLLCLHFYPVQRLLFYKFPCSRTHFLDTIVPKLKQSLSLALTHYFPLAGNLLFPLHNDDEKPVIRYVSGDSVSLTISESSSDFQNLVGNHARDADQFYDFVPPIPQLKDEPDHKTVPVFAVKATLFPDTGLCLGFSNHHSLGDGRSIVGFIKSWASISKHGQELFAKQGEPLPLYDRCVIKDPSGIDSIYWNSLKKIPPKSRSFPLPTKKVRATFVLHPSDINKLKNIVLAKKPELVQVSSFVVATAYAWTCLAKSGEEFDGDDMINFPADSRARVDPPVPDNYFGNCLSGRFVRIGNRVLRGSEGFVEAAVAVAEDIRNRVNNKDEVFKGCEKWIEIFKDFKGVRVLGVSGSPKFDLYGVDFGWGKARKVEVVSIDGVDYAMSLSRSRDDEGGLEIGFSLPKERMEAFSAIFAHDLSKSW